jgi:hypothetical protein
LGSDPNDRKNRKGIEDLRNRLIPIVSSSGEAGYRLDTSPEAIGNMVLEWESHIAHLQQKVKIARQHYGLPQLAAIRNGDHLLLQHQTLLCSEVHIW